MNFAKAVVRAVALAALVSAGPMWAEEKPITLDDFDGLQKLSNSWVAFGEIELSRLDVPDSVKHAGVQGKFVRAVAGKAGKFAVNASFGRPNYERATAVRLRAKADGVSAENPLVFEFQVFSTERRAWFWRKVTMDRKGWQTIVLPLRYFRQSPGAVLDWKEVSRFAFHFRDAGTLSVDNIELLPDAQKHPAYLSPEELGRFAFGDDARYFRDEPFVVVTDDKRLDGKAVLNALDELQKMIKRDFPELPVPKRPVVMMVFEKQDEYKVFWRELGKQFNSIVPVVTSGGYSIFGVAGSYYSDEFGPVRPVYVQEVCHALLAQVLGVSNQSEWLHEGLANYYQLHWSKQDLLALTRNMIEREKHVPLKGLLWVQGFRQAPNFPARCSSLSLA